MSKSEIQWTDHTWNPTTGCTRVSAGCDNCYAATMTKRLAAMGQHKYQGLYGKGHFNGVVELHPDTLDIPRKRKKPTKYFVNSMSDLFHKEVPFDFIDDVFAVMADCPQHTFQILTKRPERMAEYMNDSDTPHRVALAIDKLQVKIEVESMEEDINQWSVESPIEWPPTNCWMGVSIEDQQTADERIPHLLNVPAAVRFLSCEPLLGPIDLSDFWKWELACCNGYSCHCGGQECPSSLIDWVIVGGESGPGARPMNVEWARSIKERCFQVNTAFFMKQMGGHPDKLGKLEDLPEDLRIREFPQVLEVCS